MKERTVQKNEKELRMRAVEMMIRTDHLHRALIDSRAQETGVHRTQHRILMHLARHEHLPSQKELAAHLDITPAAVTGALKKMERDGYIERTLGQDNRFNEIRITEKGRDLVKLTRRLFSEADMSVFEGFSEQELEAYLRFLEKMQENMRGYVAPVQKSQKETQRKESL
jgi:DNA-binding MarR family transcriptional regulator